MDEIEESASTKSTDSASYSSIKLKSSKKTKEKLIYFDQVNIPKGDKSSIDKFISSRTNEQGKEEILVKYKVIIFLIWRIWVITMRIGCL